MQSHIHRPGSCRKRSARHVCNSFSGHSLGVMVCLYLYRCVCALKSCVSEKDSLGAHVACLHINSMCLYVSEGGCVHLNLCISLLPAQSTGADFTGVSLAQIMVTDGIGKGAGVQNLFQKQRCPGKTGHDHRTESSPIR